MGPCPSPNVGREDKQGKITCLILRSAQSRGPQQMAAPVPTKGHPKALEADCAHLTHTGKRSSLESKTTQWPQSSSIWSPEGLVILLRGQVQHTQNPRGEEGCGKALGRRPQIEAQAEVTWHQSGMASVRDAHPSLENH